MLSKGIFWYSSRRLHTFYQRWQCSGHRIISHHRGPQEVLKYHVRFPPYVHSNRWVSTDQPAVVFSVNAWIYALTHFVKTVDASSRSDWRIGELCRRFYDKFLVYKNNILKKLWVVVSSQPGHSYSVFLCHSFSTSEVCVFHQIPRRYPNNW